MQKVKKVTEITKYGYAKSIKGEIAVDVQREHLIKNGVKDYHIYEASENQTIFDAIDSFDHDEDQLVIYSGSLIGKWDFKKLNKIMGSIPQTLYICKGDITVEFVEGEEIDAIFTHIKDVEIRNGKKGGKPFSVSLKDHKRIHKMRDDNMNAKEICEALGWDKKRHTTVWRTCNRELPPEVNRENK